MTWPTPPRIESFKQCVAKCPENQRAATDASCTSGYCTKATRAFISFVSLSMLAHGWHMRHVKGHSWSASLPEQKQTPLNESHTALSTLSTHHCCSSHAAHCATTLGLPYHGSCCAVCQTPVSCMRSAPSTNAQLTGHTPSPTTSARPQLAVYADAANAASTAHCKPCSTPPDGGSSEPLLELDAECDPGNDRPLRRDLHSQGCP